MSIRELRLTLGLTQLDVARAAGLDRASLAHIELGDRGLSAQAAARVESALRRAAAARAADEEALSLGRTSIFHRSIAVGEGI